MVIGVSLVFYPLCIKLWSRCYICYALVASQLGMYSGVVPSSLVPAVIFHPQNILLRTIHCVSWEHFIYQALLMNIIDVDAGAFVIYLHHFIVLFKTTNAILNVLQHDPWTALQGSYWKWSTAQNRNTLARGRGYTASFCCGSLHHLYKIWSILSACPTQQMPCTFLCIEQKCLHFCWQIKKAVFLLCSSIWRVILLTKNISSEAYTIILHWIFVDEYPHKSPGTLFYFTDTYKQFLQF